MVVYSYYPFDPRVRKEVRALVARSCKVDVICLRDENETNKEIVDGAAIYRIPLSAKRGGYLTYCYQYLTFFVLSFFLLTKLFLTNRYDVIHIHSLPDFQVFVALVPRLFRRRIILDLHEAMPEIFAARFDLDMDSGRVALAAFLERISFKFSDIVLTVNKTIKARLVGRGLDPEKIIIIMNSPDEELRRERDMSRFIKENDLESKFVLVYVGGINQERNIEALIGAVGWVRKEIPIRMFIYGYGKREYIEELKRLRSALQLDKEIRFGGWIPHEDVFSFLKLSDVGIISYVRNPLTEIAIPNKVFEFIALRKPLIIAKLGALEELFKGAALFYEPGDSEDLAEKILRLCRDEELANRLVARAVRVHEECNWDVMKKRLYAAYDLN